MRKISKQNGITLIALIVSIVILIILASISINIVLNGGIINRAEKGAELTELAKVEEKANLIYADQKMEEYQNKEKEDVRINDIIEVLKKEKYQFEEAEGDDVVGIKLDKDIIKMPVNAEDEIKVTLERGESTKNYYVIVKGKYYRIYLNSTGVILEKTPTSIENLGSKSELKVTVDSNIITTQLTGDVIKINSGTQMRRSTSNSYLWENF